MQINIPPAEQQQLIALAASRGFDTPEEYASSILVNAVHLEAFADLSQIEMAESVRSIERGLEDKKAGRGQPVIEALDEIAKEFGFTIPR